MTDYETILQIIGGMALIIYGIHISGVSLQKVLGSYLEEALKKAGEGPLRGLLIGTGVTAAIHSSGTTAIMLIGLISASFMGLAESVPVMLGANIGSTLATQLASLRMGSVTFLIIALGVFIHMAAVKKIGKQLGDALIGFGILFLGASFVFAGIDAISLDGNFTAIVDIFTSSTLVTIVSGAFATVLFRSTSVASIFTVALGSSGALSLGSALSLILGINLGSSLKVLYMALKGKNFPGKLAYIHLISSLFGLFVFLMFFDLYYELSQATSSDTARQIANAHTLFNLIGAVIFIPFIRTAVDLVGEYAPDSEQIRKKELFYLDRKLICTPTVALAEVNRGAVEMAKISYDMLESSRLMFFEKKLDLVADIRQRESKIDDMTEKISEYAIQVSQQNLSHDIKMKLYSLLHVLADIEHLCDHIETISGYYIEVDEKKIEFSKKAESELVAVYGKLKIMQNLVIKSLQENNARLANEITEHENKVDEIIKRVVANHEARIVEGSCSEETGRYFINILNNLERVGDHYDNIAYAIIDRVKQEERK